MDSPHLIDAILDSNLPDSAKVYLVNLVRNGDGYYQQAYTLKMVAVLLAGSVNSGCEFLFLGGKDIAIDISGKLIDTLKGRETPETSFNAAEGGDSVFTVKWKGDLPAPEAEKPWSPGMTWTPTHPEGDEGALDKL
jgi:hypothetical protein